MRNLSARLLLLLCIGSGSAYSAVFLPETQIRTGYGPTAEQWSISWAGACAERVGIEVSYLGKTPLPELQSKVINFAREAVPHVVAKCPGVEIIHVDAPGRNKNRLPLIYRFELHKTKGWAELNGRWHADRISENLAAGFIPAEAAPQRKALVRMHDGRFEAIYGPRLNAHLYGDKITRHMQEGANPPRVSYHIVSGYWYELGSDRPNGSCESSRDGYALWGSFSLRISPGAARAQISRKFCASADEKGHSDQLLLTNPYPSSYKGNWGIEGNPPQKFTEVINQQLAEMSLESADDAATFASKRKPLYESNKLVIYPAVPNWCLERRLEAYYDVANEQRDQAFSGNYKKVLANRVSKLVKEYCGDAITANVANYSNVDETAWDRMSFQFRPIGAAAARAGESYPQLIDYRLSKAAQAHEDYLLANHLGPACKAEPFCELPGGRYLNAIYAGRGDLIAAMDKQHMTEVNKRASGQMAQFSGAENPLKQLLPGIEKLFPEVNNGLIIGASNKYMYAYRDWGEQCLKPGAKTREFVFTTPPSETINFDGSIDYEPGETQRASYTTNPEFFTLLERVGSHYGAPGSKGRYLNQTYRLVLQGIEQMKFRYRCDSAEVAQFERNLIVLAEQNLNGETLSVLSVPAGKASNTSTNSVVKPVADDVQTKPKPVASSETAPPPVDQPSRARAVPAQPAPAPVKPAGLSKEQRRQQMGAELKALSDSYTTKVNAANQAFQAEMKHATTDAERLEKLKVFQARMAEMRTQVEQETQAIKQKYR